VVDEDGESGSRGAVADDFDELDERPSRSSSSSSRSSSSSSRSSSSDKPSSSSRASSSRYEDLDKDNSRTRKPSSGNDNAPTAVVAGRIGYSKFQGLGFVTYGAEVSFMATKTLAILGGVEAYSTKRAVPEELQDQGAPPEIWNTILPFNLGLAYRFLDGSVQPYAGADVIMIPGYVKDTSGLATGLRLRAGADFMVSDKFGFNLNTSVGMWAGQNFEQVDTSSSSAALVPQFSGGTVVHF
jgi:hypothetical protein